MREKIHEVMSRDVFVVSPEWRIADVARLMRTENIGAVPVAEDEQLVGIITDRDLVLRGLADGGDTRECTARDVMTVNLFYCFDDQTVDDALRKMHEQHVRRLPVVDRRKRLVGMVSLSEVGAAIEVSPGATMLRRVSRAGLH